MHENNASRRLVLDAALAEFSALREEISLLTRRQHFLVNLNLIAVGTIGAFAIEKKQYEIFF